MEKQYITSVPMGGFGFYQSEFSSVANSAFLIKNGEIQYPLLPITIAGNIWEGLKSILAIGNNPRMMRTGGTETPALAFKGFMVSG
ncbi:MAG: metallopeptidase TldD-related protein [Candidatus Hodarchaeota archaeon]